MLRISQYLKTLTPTLTPTLASTLASTTAARDSALRTPAKPRGPVVIWNLIRRCNLTCHHCYTTSANIDFPGELNTEQVKSVMGDLREAQVPALILSGGEPLMRPDIFELAETARELGFYVALSTNGTLISEQNITRIANAGFQYIGISIDGLRETHDRFRQQQGSFDAALRGVELCKEAGIRVGLRFTLTQDNAKELPAMLDIMEQKQVDRFYLSHLNYSGRGKRNAKLDAFHQMTRDAMELIFARAWAHITDGYDSDFTSGNNDADGPLLLQWAKNHIEDIQAQQLSDLHRHLEHWGGNASGINVANIDNLGEVHPDTYWWNHNLGNVLQNSFNEIWHQSKDPLILGLRQKPRPLKGRCAQCQHFKLCGGNTRTRAFALTGDPWEEDPGCYLSDEEIGYKSDVPSTEQIPTVAIS